MATANIAEELTCPICLELYKDPRLLPCHHSICKSCLVALCSRKENDSDIWLHCPSCRHHFEAKDEMHIESLPKNFTLASIVCKFRESVKGDKVFQCDVCEDDKKGRAIKKCLQCQVNYCRSCLEQLHPKRGVLASHKLVHIMDAYGEENKDEELSPSFLSSVFEIQSVSTPKCDQLRRERYCMPCDEICTKGDNGSVEGIHEHHVTIKMRSAVRRKREEVKCILARLLDEEQDLAKGLANITSLIETIRKKVEVKKIELIQRFRKLTEEVDRKKSTAEKRMEEEMKKCITSLESCLYKLEDLKAKTKIKIAAFSELSSLSNDEANLFLIKLKELQNEIGPGTEDCIQRAIIGTECDSYLPTEQLMNDIISNAMLDICPSERSLPVHDPILSSKHAPMKIKVTSVQMEETVSADIEWVATQSVDHYEISYICDSQETVLQQKIVENRCRLTTLKWDSAYTVRVTAYLQDGKIIYDSAIFKTDPKVKDPNPVKLAISSKPAFMAINVTKFQNNGTLFADVEWMAMHQVDHYNISYFWDPRERILQENIVENRCRLMTLGWDTEYTITVTAYLLDQTTSYDSAIFKTDPRVKDTKPAITDISPKRVKMALKVITIQKAGIMSADVKWTDKYQPGVYEVSYCCNPDETVVLKNIAENRCMLTNLRWDSTYTVKVTTELQDGTRVYNDKAFNTDPQVKCFPMAVSEVCNEKIDPLYPFDAFIASNKIEQGVDFNRIGKFGGIVYAPVLKENVHFWTMNIELSIFEATNSNFIYFDFGIITYCNLRHCFSLFTNRAAYSCSIIQLQGRKFHLLFRNRSNSEGHAYQLPLELYQKADLCYGFLYNKLNSQFAVVDCLSQAVLHVFHDVKFRNDIPPIFAVCPYHTKWKMRVKIELNHVHATNEDISSWMQKISKFSVTL